MSGTTSSLGLVAPVSSSTLAAAVSAASGGTVPASLITSLTSGNIGAASAAGMSFLAANGINLGAAPSAASVVSSLQSAAASNPFAAQALSINNAFASAISSSAASGSNPLPALQAAGSSALGSIILPNSGGESLLTFLGGS